MTEAVTQALPNIEKKCRVVIKVRKYDKKRDTIDEKSLCLEQYKRNEYDAEPRPINRFRQFLEYDKYAFDIKNSGTVKFKSDPQNNIFQHTKNKVQNFVFKKRGRNFSESSNDEHGTIQKKQSEPTFKLKVEAVTQSTTENSAGPDAMVRATEGSGMDLDN